MEKKFHQAPNIYVKQVSITVTSIQRSVYFYQKVVGFQVEEKTDKKAILTTSNSETLLILNSSDEITKKERHTTGLFHFALLLPNRSDLSAFLKHLFFLKQPFGSADHEVSEAVYIKDPDGNGIEVYHDRASSEWSWSRGEVSMVTVPLNQESILTESKKEWNGLPQDSLIGHVHLHVSNLESAENFYVKGLGFQVVCRLSGATFVSTGLYHHHIGFNIWNGVDIPSPSRNSVGMNWYQLKFPDEQAILEVVKQLQNQGYEVTSKENQLHYTTDPSGNKIILGL